MFQWLKSPVLWGILLILAGVLFLIQELSGIQLGSIFWGVMLILGGALFLIYYASHPVQWWAIIPGVALIGIGLSQLLGVLYQPLEDAVGGLLVLGSIGAGFFGLYWKDRRMWWAIIPAGVLFTLGMVSALENILPEPASNGFFFVGLGLTFALLAWLPTPAGKMTWAWIPALVLVVIGLFIIAAAEQMLVYVGPLLIILAGLFLIIRTLATRRSGS